MKQIACANNNNQIPKSLSSSYDGIWDGYAQSYNGRLYIKGEIKNGIVSGFVEDITISGYITSDNNLIVNPIYIYFWREGYKQAEKVNFDSSTSRGRYGSPEKVIIEANFMSPDRIEGTVYADRLFQKTKSDWFVVKPATGKSDVTISNDKKGQYDGIWEGYAYSTEVPYTIKVEIKNGILSGFVGDTKITGYINADNQLIGDPFFFKTEGTVYRVTGESKFMSPDRIEGIYTTEKSGLFKWFIVKAGTDKPEITISHIQINERAPWTGKFRVEATSQVGGIWAMKQEGKIVVSTKDSDYDFKGKVHGNQLKGNLEGASYLPLIVEMSSDYMSFKGKLELIGRNYHLKGKRIE
jgi:hypothetical protein